MKYTLEDQHIRSYGFLYLSFKTPNGEQTPFHAPTTLSNKNSRNSYLNNVGQKLTPSFFSNNFFYLFYLNPAQMAKGEGKGDGKGERRHENNGQCNICGCICLMVIIPPILIVAGICMLASTNTRVERILQYVCRVPIYPC